MVSHKKIICAGIVLLCALLSAFSQIMLKQSAQKRNSSSVGYYLNWRVFSAYGIFALTLFLNIYALTGIEYKLASVFNATAYLFTMILSVWLLKDSISWQCAVGNVLIIFGIVIYVW